MIKIGRRTLYTTQEKLLTRVLISIAVFTAPSLHLSAHSSLPGRTCRVIEGMQEGGNVGREAHPG